MMEKKKGGGGGGGYVEFLDWEDIISDCECDVYQKRYRARRWNFI